MQPAIQDPIFAVTYEGLPDLPCVYTFLLRSNFTDPFSRHVFNIQPYGYDKRISDGSVRSLVQGLMWTQHGSYIHSARIRPDLLTVKSRRLALNNSSNAFCIDVMFGVVTASHLFDLGVDVGNLASTYKQKRIGIIGFEQDFLRATANVCSSLGLRSDPMGTYSSYGLAFVTRGEGKSVAFKYSGEYAVPAPAQRPVISDDSLFTISLAPVAPVPNFNNPTESVINYKSRVPVYDGHVETGVPFHF
ncbi:hypothetical protein C0995_015790 [Termitomyces sp. Mi166|nr:hypothetical protein C0995_015790 [Termitomyces sp. Mi166\